MQTHPFDAALALQPADGGATGHLQGAYGNMIGRFGGIVAAAMLKAVLTQAQCQGTPVAMTVNFASALADADFFISTKLSRATRTTQHWSLELSQGEQITTTASLVMAVRAQTWTDTELSMPVLPGPAALPMLDVSAYPAWTRRYAMRIIAGGLSPDLNALESSQSLTQLWVRDEPPRPLDYPALMALSDIFFPRVFVRRQRLMPAGTVSMTTYFHADAAALQRQGERELLACARAQRFHQGFFDQSAELWSAAGELLVTSHQIVYFKDASR